MNNRDGPNHVGCFHEHESPADGGQPSNDEQQVDLIAGTSAGGGCLWALDVFLTAGGATATFENCCRAAKNWSCNRCSTPDQFGGAPMIGTDAPLEDEVKHSCICSTQDANLALNVYPFKLDRTVRYVRLLRVELHRRNGYSRWMQHGRYATAIACRGHLRGNLDRLR